MPQQDHTIIVDITVATSVDGPYGPESGVRMDFSIGIPSATDDATAIVHALLHARGEAARRLGRTDLGVQATGSTT